MRQCLFGKNDDRSSGCWNFSVRIANITIRRYVRVFGISKRSHLYLFLKNIARYGRKRIIECGSLILFIITLLMPVSPYIQFIIVCRFMCGFAYNLMKIPIESLSE